MIQVINFLADYLLIELWDISLLSIPDSGENESLTRQN